MRIEARLEEVGLALPEPVKPAPGIELSFAWIRVRGNRAYVSGPLNPDGSIAGPFGKVGVELSLEQGYEAARLMSHVLTEGSPDEQGLPASLDPGFRALP